MKKILLIILTVLMVLSFGAACSQPNNSQKYSVTYQAGEGAGQAYTVEVEKGDHILLDYTELNFTAPTYKAFDYWQIGDPKTAEKQAGDTISVSSDMTIIAVWKETREECTITYQAGEGTGVEYTVDMLEGEHTLLDYTELNFTAPTYKAFDYWQIGDPKTAEKQAGDTISVSSDMTIIAVWKETREECTITYQAGEGNGQDRAISTFEGEYTLLDYAELGFTAPTDKEFDYWQIGEPKTAEKQAGDTIELGSNLSIIAVWKIKVDATTQLAVGKTVDLGSLFTDSVLGKEVTWSIMDGEECVKMSIGGDNLQALSSGEIILRATSATDTYTVKIESYYATEVEEVVDFVVTVPSGRDIKVLQITDTQLVDSSQASIMNLNELYRPENFDKNCFNYIRDAVERTNPDLIIMTGDNVYGIFDDNGSALTKLIAVMDSFEIPWAAVYGNHDNESEKGAQWQNEQYQNSEYGLFLRGVTDGNGNYTIGIKQGDEINRVFVMMDTNQCTGAHEPTANYVTTAKGFTNDQITWFNRTTGEMLALNSNVKVSMGYHIPNYAFTQAMQQYENQLTDTYYYSLGLDVVANSGDFGSNNQRNSSDAGDTIDYNGSIKKYSGKTLLEIFKDANVDSVFVGHQHDISLSMLYEGIRWTFGLKTGVYDVSNSKNLGGTLITIDDENGAVAVKHIYYDQDYQEYRDGLITNPKNITIDGMIVIDKKSSPDIYADVPQRTRSSKEYIDGYGAYKIDSNISGEMLIRNTLLQGKKSVTFSFYVPSDQASAKLSQTGTAFAIRQKTTSGSSVYVPLVANGVETSTNERAISYNYNEWTTVTIDINVNGVYMYDAFAWMIAPENAIYLKDIELIDADPKSDLPVNITIKKDGVVVQDDATVQNIKAEIEKLYYVAGDLLDITKIASEKAPKGYKFFDTNDNVLAVTVQSTGSINFVINYQSYENNNIINEHIFDDETGVMGKAGICACGLCYQTVTDITSSADIAAGYTGKYINFSNNSDTCLSFIYFKKDFLKEMIDSGNTILNVVARKGVNEWSHVKFYDGDLTKYNELLFSEQKPYDITSYTTYTLDLATVTIDDYLCITVELAKNQVKLFIYEITFTKPETYENKNLLDNPNLFDEEGGLMGKGENCTCGACWQQYLDRDGYETKYMNLYDGDCTNCDSYIYFHKDFLEEMLSSGYTTLTITAKTDLDGWATGMNTFNIRLSDSDLTKFDTVIAEVNAGNIQATTTFTFDLSDVEIENYLALTMEREYKGAKLMIYDICFSRPAN